MSTVYAVVKRDNVSWGIPEILDIRTYEEDAYQIITRLRHHPNNINPGSNRTLFSYYVDTLSMDEVDVPPETVDRG